MDARQLKHMALLEEWKERVAECRGSGQSVRAWCRERSVSITAYYRWEKEILSEAGRQMAVRENAVEKRFVEVPVLPEQTDTSSGNPTLAARLRIKGGELEVYAGADEAVLETLLRVMRDVE